MILIQHMYHSVGVDCKGAEFVDNKQMLKHKQTHKHSTSL